MKISLFDLDGVLVKPNGYRKAFFDTCAWIVDQTGLTINLPGKEIPALYESYGVTSEWDMLAISASILLDSFCQQTDYVIQADTLQDAFQEISRLQFKHMEVDFRFEIQKLSPLFKLDDIPSVAVYQYINATSCACLFQHKILEEVLCHTRSVQGSLITAVFQNMVLGEVQFQKNYQKNAWIDCESYLLQYDKALISDDWLKRIDAIHKQGVFQCAALTARPSLGPRDFVALNQGDFSPEAEFALDVIKMPDMVLIGYGRLQFIANELGVIADSLIKPNAFHALAAIFAILANSEQEGLELAINFLKSEGRELPHFTLAGENISYPDSVEIAVFEDSQGGIRSLKDAAKLLVKAGLVVETKYFGISQNIDKINTLQSLGATIFPTVNEALEVYFN